MSKGKQIAAEVGKTVIGMLAIAGIAFGALLLIISVAILAQNAPAWVDTAGKVVYIGLSVLLLGGTWVLFGNEIGRKIFRK